MKPLILLLLASSCVFAQTATQPPVKLKNWRERFYRNYKMEDLQAAQKRLASSQELLDKYRATPNLSYPEYLKEQESLVAKHQDDLKAAESELAKVDAMLSDPGTRKAFNKELESLLRRRNEEIRARYGSRSSSSSYPSTRNFRIDCYSGGYGRHFWVRCTSSWY